MPRCRQGVPAGRVPAERGQSEHRRPGTPYWVDLASPDLADAKRFYRSCSAGPVSSPRSRRRAATRSSRGRPAGRRGGAPATPDQVPIWTTYIATDDADLAAARVDAAGGKVLMAPLDVMD